MSIDCGILFPFRNPDFNRRAWTDVYRDDLALAVDCEALGYDHVWLTEHHFVDDGYSPSLLPIASAIAMQTRRVRIGTFVLLLPLHNTVRLAEDVATTDIIAAGRLDLGVGLGYRVGEFAGMGVSPRERGARFAEQLPLLRRLLDGERVSFEGKYHSLADTHAGRRPCRTAGVAATLALHAPGVDERAAGGAARRYAAQRRAVCARGDAATQARRPGRPRQHAVSASAPVAARTGTQSARMTVT